MPCRPPAKPPWRRPRPCCPISPSRRPCPRPRWSRRKRSSKLRLRKKWRLLDTEVAGRGRGRSRRGRAGTGGHRGADRDRPASAAHLPTPWRRYRKWSRCGGPVDGPTTAGRVMTAAATAIRAIRIAPGTRRVRSAAGDGRRRGEGASVMGVDGGAATMISANPAPMRRSKRRRPRRRRAGERAARRSGPPAAPAFRGQGQGARPGQRQIRRWA